MNIQRVDLALFSVVLLIGILFGAMQATTMPGVPTHGRYHPSDMDDLQSQLLGHSVLPKPYAASSDHPAWIMICGVYQRISRATGLDGMRLWNVVTPLLLGLNLCLFMGVARQLNFTRRQALAVTAVFLATGATVTWSVVLETHVLAPTGLLIAALLLTNRRFTSKLWSRPTPATIATYGVAIAIAAAVTITNIMLALLAVIARNPFRHFALSRLVSRTAVRLPTLGTAFLAAIGLLAFAHLTGWYLSPDREMRQFLELIVHGAGDGILIFQGIPGSRWESTLSLAWIAPPIDAYVGSPEILELLQLERTWKTAPAYVSGFLVTLLTLCSLRVVSARALFIPAFALFGVTLHSIYGLGESFLFSANYTWASVLSIGLLGRATIGRRFEWIAWPLAVLMLTANILIWMHGIDWIVAQGHLLPNASQ